MLTTGRIHRIRWIRHEKGYCYVANLPRSFPLGDDEMTPHTSTLRLFENGVELGPALCAHDEIRRVGKGQFSHWARQLFFSASDNSDPRLSFRSYSALVQLPSDPRNHVVSRAAMQDVTTLDYRSRYDWAEKLFSALVPEEHLSDYERSFFREEQFRSDFASVESNFRSFDRKFALREFFQLAMNLPGDVAECGVFRGASSYVIARAAERAGVNKMMHLFDSFGGLSSPGQHDGDYWHKGDMSADLDEVRRILAAFSEHIRFYPGWIPDRFHEVSDLKFCFVHIDVDLYEPTRNAVEFFGQRMVPGGLIVCDDYGFETCPGARRAIDEFVSRHDSKVVHLPTGQGVIFFPAS